MSRRLSPKQQKFVQEYLIDLNASQAAIRAGYSEKMAGRIGFQLLEKTRIQDAVAVEQQARSARTGITPDRALQELAILGFSDLTDFVEWDGQTVILKNSADLDKTKRRAIAEISQTKDGVRIKLHDKKGALDSIARHLGMFNDKTTVGLDAATRELLALMSGGNHVLNRVKTNDAG
jgi:phage terminase small subunit